MVAGKNIRATYYTPKRIEGIFHNHIIVWRRYNYSFSILRKIVKYTWDIIIKSFFVPGIPSRKLAIAAWNGIRSGWQENIILK